MTDTEILSEPGILILRKDSGIVVATGANAGLLLKEINVDGTDISAASYFKKIENVKFT